MKRLSYALLIIVQLGLIIPLNACTKQENTTEQIANASQVILKLDQFKSECCVGLVAYTLREVEGVRKYEANVKNQEMRVWYDPSEVSLQEIIDAVNQTPYKVLSYVEE